MKLIIKIKIASVFILFGFINLNGQTFLGESEVFEPGVISMENTWDEYISFSPDGNTLTFTRSGDQLSHKERRIYFSNKVNGKWTTPSLAPFSGNFFDRGSSFSPDGKTLFFGSNRPGEKGFDNDSDIWFSSMKFDGSWSEATRMPNIINSDKYHEGHPSLAKNKNLYFVRYRRGEETDIYVSKWINGVYSEPEKLNVFINSEGPDSHCYIDPEERYLLFGSSRPDSFGAGDIYISYFINGDWTKAENLGNLINTKYYEYSAKPGSDNRLYFTRANFSRDNPSLADIYFIRYKSLFQN